MPFPHERLDAYHRAVDALRLARAVPDTLPGGLGDEARQIHNAAASVVRNLCEGASRYKPAEKVQKFEIAAGEAGEAAGAVQALMVLGLGDPELGERFLEMEGRAAAMLTGLIRRHRR